MEYGNCTCQATCDDPQNLFNCQNTCREHRGCVCREGFLKKGAHCVSSTECGCYIQENRFIPNGQSYVRVDCSSRCQCQSNVLTCDDNYGCSPDATCEERDGVRQCYCNGGYAGDGQNCKVNATDCADIYKAGVTESGVYYIKPKNWPGSPFEVFCEVTPGGGWTVFQRRKDGSVDFYQGWNRYKYGFGSPNHELWLGNEKIFYLTNQRNYQLRIDLMYGTGRSYFAKYNLFRINNEDDEYRLAGLGSFSGSADQDRLTWHKGKQFSTPDRDNDGWSQYHCAQKYRGAWWYGLGDTATTGNCATDEFYCDWWPLGSDSCGWCAFSNLNGNYNGMTWGTRIDWESDLENDCNVINTEMKIKPV
ncbi:Fibrinogen C domain-containing protein 1 [Holothuria leucospilota]|uniref:Fibrinogen C domain-containing protein 1 n=1 Tax=Holothuria leucospilota TaxID=206669 RepID=A0A9Q1BVJ7_HOLLE|nr:Fibrinogen C domain-containing protein 1 [Holothuria leucospilota]